MSLVFMGLFGMCITESSKQTSVSVNEQKHAILEQALLDKSYNVFSINKAISGTNMDVSYRGSIKFTINKTNQAQNWTAKSQKE